MLNNGSSGTFDTNGYTITAPGTVSGGGSLRISGGGTLILSGSSNSYSGGTTISAGTLQIGDGVSASGSLPGNVVNNASLVFANPSALAVGGTISGTGSVTANGAGTLTLSAANTYTGGTTISGGGTVRGPIHGPGLWHRAHRLQRHDGGQQPGELRAAGHLFTVSCEQFLADSQLRDVRLVASHVRRVWHAESLDHDDGVQYRQRLPRRNTAAPKMFSTPTTPAWSTSPPPARTCSAPPATTASMIWIDGVNVVSNDGEQSPTTVTSVGIPLSAGEHNIVVGYFQGGGGLTFTAQMGTADGDSSTLAPISTSMTNGASITPDLLIGSLQGTGNVSLTTGNLILGSDNTSQSFGGVISGIGGVLKFGTGIQTFTNVNQYTGGTTIAGGELNINSDAALGATSSVLTLAGGSLQAGALFSLDPSRSVVAEGGGFDTNNNTLTVPGVISGSGSLGISGGGTLVVTGASNTYSGGTIVSAGTLQIGDGASSNGSLPGNVVNNATLTFNNPTTFANSGNISGSGVTNIVGAGPLTLNGAISGSQRVAYSGTGGALLAGNNSYTGGTSINSGTVTAQGTGLGVGTVNIASGATLSISNGGNTGLLSVYYASATGFAAPTMNAVTPTMNFATFPAPYNSLATNFGAFYTGAINVLEAGSYTFNSSSDDISTIYVDGNAVVSSTYLNGTGGVTSAAINLTAGEHQVLISYFQGTGGYFLGDKSAADRTARRWPISAPAIR